MKELLIFVLFAFVISADCQMDEEEINERAEKLAKMMKHDGVERVVTMTQKNMKNLLKKYSIVVVLFHAQTNATILKQEKYPLEVVAKLFDKKGVVCAICNILKNMELAKETDVFYPGVIKIFNRGKPTSYFGQRSPDVMVPYISKMFEPAVTHIVSKTGKKAFDVVQLPKVIAFVQKDSPEYRELHNAALHFQPMVQFHAVFDTKLAKSLQMKKSNSLIFIKPFEKAIKMPASVTWQEKKLIEFIRNNRRQLIRKMMLENIHEIWSPDMKGYLVAVFAKIESPDGNRFFSLVKTLARSFADNERLNFVWIDPDPFPAMKEYWQATFNVDPTKPTMGAVDLAGQSSTWLVPREDKELKLPEMKKWTNDLLSGKLKLKPMKTKSTADDEANDAEDKTENKASLETDDKDLKANKDEL